MKVNVKKLLFLLLLFSFASLTSKAQVPANDNPCNATPLTVGTSCVYVNATNVNATNSAGVPAPGCANYSGADVWFSAVVPANGVVLLDANTGTMNNGAMAAYSGTCGSLSLISCNNNGSANGQMPALTITGQAPGSTIWIRFWSPGSNDNGTFSICASTIAPCNPANSNSACSLADPFCAGATTNLCNTTNVSSLGGGGIYGCLNSTPNPAFYFLNIATSGSIDLLISQQTNSGVGIDVDFIVWGPFASQAAMCSGLAAGNIVDCSFSIAAVETANIPNAIAGQWYMFLVTNYANVNGVIQIDQTNSGDPLAGSTNCNLITANPDICSGGTFTLNGTVQTSTIPSSGTLTVSTSCGGSAVYNAPFNFTNNYSISGLPACGQNCTVNAVFSAPGAPVIIPATFNATNCNTLTAVAGACSGGQYTLSGSITAGCLPSTGTLTVTSSCGGTVTLNAPFVNPINWSLPPSSGNGGNCTVTATFSASGAPIINPITIAEPSCCGASVGTYNVNVVNGTSSVLANGIEQIILCPGGSITINSNNDYTLPPDGCGACTAGMMFAIYSAAGPTGPDPDLDPNWTGYYWVDESFPGTGGGGYNVNSSGNCSPLFSFPSDPALASMHPANNSFVFVPITGDDADLLFPYHDTNGDGCFNIGLGYAVTYLNPITFNAVNGCGGTMKIEITGGYPEFFSGTYSLTNTGAGTLSATTITSGGVVTVSGLSPFQTVSFSVTDANGCTSTFSKNYTNVPLPTINITPANPSVCAGNCTTLTASVTPNVSASVVTFSSNICKSIPDGGIGGGNNGNINNGEWAMSPINISDYCGVNYITGQTFQVCINITHTWDADVNVFLQAPNGVLLSLTSDDGNGGNNFSNTCFTATNVNVIGSPGNNAAPFGGTFAPDGPGGFAVFNGTPINGVWKLWVADDTDGEFGNLLNWTIGFNNQSAYNFVWAADPTLSSTTILNPNVCPTATTIYSVTATNSCGCSATANSTVTVYPVPSATIAGTATICSGNTSIITFTGTPNVTVTYTINGGSNQTIVLDATGNGSLTTASLSVNTTYALVNAFYPGCSQPASGSAVITVGASPIATFSYPTPLCTNGLYPTPTFLGGGTAGVFSATPAGLNFVSTSTGEIDLSTSLPNTYTITNTIAAAGACPQATATFNVTINTPIPTSINYNGAPYCTNYVGTVNPIITGTLGGTFSSTPAGLVMNVSGTINPSLSAAGTYTVTYQVPVSLGCASYNVTQTVEINALPTIPTINPNPPCAGASTNFTASGGSFYEFILNGTSQSPPSNAATATIGPLAAGDQVCVKSYPAIPINFNGLITEAEWGNPIATSTGGPTVSGFAAGNNLDALYLKNSSGYLYGALAGNVVNGSNNRILLFIDCQPGGFNNLGAWVIRNNAPYYSVENLNSITFDVGFTPEYVLAMNQAAGNSFFDLYNMVTNTNNFLGDGAASPWLGFTGNSGVGDFTKGFEFAFPMSAIGNPSTTIKVFAMLVNNPGTPSLPNTTISNQFLTPCGTAESNYGNGPVDFSAALPNPIPFVLSADCFSQLCVTTSSPITPTFSFQTNICNGAVAPVLPGISNNGINGTWSPTSISNTASNSYLFTPSSGCAIPTTINVTVVPNPGVSPLFHD